MDLEHLHDLHHLTSLSMVADLQALLALNKHLQALHNVQHLQALNKDLQALLLTQPMECRTLGISGGRQRKDLQHLNKKPLKVPTFLQKTSSRPLDG